MAKSAVSPIAKMIRHMTEDHFMRTLSDQELLRRFTSEQNEPAFGGLLRRHGTMVLDVCRKTAGNEADAEDAFQATFLILAQKAKSIRNRASVGSWLHGVAYRTALKARKEGARRHKRESNAQRSTAQESADGLPWCEVQQLIHAELSALAERYRAPLVLCFLEGKTQDEAAKQLAVSVATLKKRLERGRALLRMRLVRQGLGPAALVAAAAWPAASAAAFLPPTLKAATLKAAMMLAAGQAAAGLVSGHVVLLMESALRTMLFTKLKITTAVLLAFALVPTIGGVAYNAQSTKRSRQVAEGAKLPQATRAELQAPEAKLESKEDKDSIAYGGRVLGPDGQPVSGAKLYLNLGESYLGKANLSQEVAMTGRDGRFTFKVSKAKFGDHFTCVAAAATNYGAAWVTVTSDSKREDLTLQLVKDDLPITGQIIDMEGKPVSGATIRVLQIQAAPGEDITPWLNAIEGKEWRDAQKYLNKYTTALSPVVNTKPDGRFRLTGIGPNRLVIVRLDGPTIASQYLRILTRTGKSIKVPEFEGSSNLAATFTTYYGADFRYAAGPTRPIVGVVRDKDTKKPLAGMTIRSEKLANTFLVGTHIVQTTTDDQGHYRLTGMPRGEGNIISLLPGLNQPYLMRNANVPNPAGLDPVTVDIELKRGVWIEGNITDKVTGKSLKGVMRYIAMMNNPNLPEYSGVTFPFSHGVETKDDGSYRLVGLPGPGAVAVYWRPELWSTSYLIAPEREDEFGAKDKNLRTYTHENLSDYAAIARIDPAKGLNLAKQDITLDPGWTFTGTVVGPDGKTLTEKQRMGLTGWGWRVAREHKITPFTGLPKHVIFRHAELGLIGVTKSPQEKGGSVTMRMETGATVTGRLIDENSKPRVGVDLMVVYEVQDVSDEICICFLAEAIMTDQNGTFRIQALLPGYEYRLSDHLYNLNFRSVTFGSDLQLGQTKDLGDVRLKRRGELKESGD